MTKKCDDKMFISSLKQVEEETKKSLDQQIIAITSRIQENSFN